MEQVAFTVAADREVGPCRAFWTVANINRPYRLLEPGYLDDLRRRSPFVRELNLVYLLGGRTEEHNRWFLGAESDGSPRTDFSGLLAQLRAAMDHGYTPRIVLDNVPPAMSDPPEWNAFGNTAPPADERLWHRYVGAAVEAMVREFGRDAVGRWWFRVGTEPDLLPGHWSGTKEQYFAHYDFTADAVLGVLPGALIGPGNILNPVEGEYGIIVEDQWGLEIADHVATGRNACTGGQGAPIRWFSCSWYGRVGVPLAKFDKAVAMMRERLGRYSLLADLPLAIGEFAVLHDEHGRRIHSGEATEWAASFYAGIADRVWRYGLDQVYEWAQSTQGVLHPRTQVTRMMERMVGGRLLEVSGSRGPDDDCGIIACRRGDELLLLVYNHGTGRSPKIPRKVRIVICDSRLTAGDRVRMSEWSVDEQHGVWVYAFDEDCRAAGLEPDPEAGSYEGDVRVRYGEAAQAVFAANREKYERLAAPLPTLDGVPLATGKRRLSLDLDLPGHSVQLVQLSRG